MLRSISLTGLLLLAAIAAFTAPARPLAASECGEDGWELCTSTVECRGFWIFKKCGMPEWDYYPGW